MPLPVKVESRKAMFEANPALCENGAWVTLIIVPNVTWPVRAQSVVFEGFEVWIIPITLDDYPGVAVKRTDAMTQDDAEGLLYRILSMISWREGVGIAVEGRGGGNLPRTMGLRQKSGFAICEAFDFTDFIAPKERNALLALALMREGRSLNHFGYAFLSFWRILELSYPRPEERVNWMKEKLSTISGIGVSEGIASIIAAGVVDISRHLFESGRCAIAHARAQPIINPDDPRDSRRLMGELPIVREMAVMAIEERFGVESSSTEYKKHLYELRGWKEIIGSDVIARVAANDPTLEDEIIDLPNIHVRLHGCRPYSPLESMLPVALGFHNSIIELVYSSPDKLIQIKFILDFLNERLIFDVGDGIYSNDDGSVVAATYRREIDRFIRDYFLNGKLLMYDAKNEKIISRLDAFIPVNCFINLDACNKAIEAAEEEISRRRSASVGNP